MTPNRFDIVVQPNDDDKGATFVVLLEVIGFPDKEQAEAFSKQLSQWVAATDNHDGR